MNIFRRPRPEPVSGFRVNDTVKLPDGLLVQITEVAPPVLREVGFDTLYFLGEDGQSCAVPSYDATLITR